MKCETCVWWQVGEEDRYSQIISPLDPNTFDQEETEDAIAEKWGHVVRRCKSPHVTFYQRPERDGATVCDGSEYYAELLTGPDFGCVHHHQKGAI